MIEAGSPHRIPVMLDLVRQIWELNPKMRLGQLITDAIGAGSPYWMEDTALEPSLQKMLYAAKLASANTSKRTP